MNVDNPLFLMPALMGPGVILSGLINLIWPAKKINDFYGYRTKSSKKSKERWDFAQIYHAKEMIRLGIFMLMISMVGLFIHMENRKLATLIGLIYALILVLLVIFSTQKAIREKFDSRPMK